MCQKQIFWKNGIFAKIEKNCKSVFFKKIAEIEILGRENSPELFKKQTFEPIFQKIENSLGSRIYKINKWTKRSYRDYGTCLHLVEMGSFGLSNVRNVTMDQYGQCSTASGAQLVVQHYQCFGQKIFFQTYGDNA